jgi:hypothetical protein
MSYFKYAGYYTHSRGGLSLTNHRFYNSALQLCVRAIAVAFPQGLPGPTEDMAMGTFSEELSKLSDDFRGCEDIFELLYEFVVQHPEEFGPPTFPEARQVGT